ncbi:MAG: Lsr2 family protein [Ferruginibacter sp.]
MATKVVVELLDDTDGSQADETVSFGLDGVHYEIDLSATNAEDLRHTLATFVANARRAGKRSAVVGAVSGPGRSEAERERLGVIRAWAREQEDITVSERGRLPKSVIEAYESAMAALVEEPTLPFVGQEDVKAVEVAEIPVPAKRTRAAGTKTRQATVKKSEDVPSAPEQEVKAPARRKATGTRTRATSS